MNDTNTGGPAFPSSEFDSDYQHTFLTGGMTLRDYFAAKAMQGILFEGLTENETARHAYLMADAMLKARNI